MFTLPQPRLPHSPQKGLATTSVIESPQSGVARGTATVTRWRDREIVERALATILRRQPSAIAGEGSVK
jgi:hypothetical protein